MTDTAFAFLDIAPSWREIDGKFYLEDAKGAWVPEELVRAQDRLQDEVVRRIAGFAMPLSSQVARFREHCFDDVDAFVGLLEQNYAVKPSRKGNIQLTTLDGRFKVQVQVADQIQFGPELQLAKALVDECLTGWASDARPEIRAIVNQAFNVDQAGRVNRAGLIQLTRLDIADARWKRAMLAISDSMKVIGSKRYVRIYRRDRADGPWEGVAIDVAAA